MKALYYYLLIQLIGQMQIWGQASPPKHTAAQEKEIKGLYIPIKYSKFTGTIPYPTGAIWPANNSELSSRFEHTDKDGSSYMSNMVTIKGTPKTEKQIIHYYKIDAQLNYTHYLSFEGLRYENGVPGELDKNTFITKTGDIYMFNGSRNGILIYRIDKNGNRTTVAGNPFNYKKLKDGYGQEASITNAYFLNETADGHIVFLEKIYKDYVHEDFPNIKFNTLGYCFLWRMIAPDGKIKTITNNNGEPINQYVYTNILIDQSGYWYFGNDDQLVKIKPEESNVHFEVLAGNRSPQELRYIGQEKGSLRGTWYKLGDAKQALIPNLTHLAWGQGGEIFLYSSSALRIVKYKDGIVSHFSGTSDLKSWFEGKSLGANCDTNGEKDGSSTSAVICHMKSMKWINNNLVLLKKDVIPDPNNPNYYLPSFKISLIDQFGNVKTLPIGQNYKS